MANAFESAREEFKVFDSTVYLNWAGSGPMPLSAYNAVTALLRDLYQWKPSVVKSGLGEMVSNARTAIAELMNAEKEEIAITGTNTSQAVQTALEAVGMTKGDSMVTSDMQYVLTEAESQKWRERGVEIRVVKNREGLYDPADFAEKMDESTRVVLLDSVTWINGYRFDVPEIARIAHEHNALVITDSIQHLGQSSLDTKTFGADMVAGGAQKWLSDWLGLGFLWVRKSIIPDLCRPYYGYKNTFEPEGGWHAHFTRTDRELFPNFSFYNDDARKFEYGGSLYNMPGLVALTETLKLINGIGIDRIQEKILSLKSELIEGLEDMNLDPLAPFDSMHQSGITTFRTGLGRKNEMEIVEQLNNSGFSLSYRAGGGLSGIRVSTHYVNNSMDVQKFLEALKPMIRSRARGVKA